jgi:hypothetical protein
MKDSSTELTVICAEAGEWGKPTRQLRGAIPIRRNQSRKREIIILKLAVTELYIPNFETEP